MNEVTVEKTEEIEKKYNLRALQAKDVFTISRIISAIGFANFKRCFENEEVKDLVKKAVEGGETVEAVGMAVVLDIADVLFAYLPNCERELFAFLADLLGMKVADVEAIPPADFFDLVIEVVQKPDFADFFKRAARLFK